jgi:hypothetical protein
MELKEFIGIFVKDRKVFFGIILGSLILGLIVFRFQPARYETALTLNIARTGTDTASDYKYDQFYRLQADERFADTVVRWLAAPAIRADIVSGANVSLRVVESMTAKRLSSQMIDVRYFASRPAEFGKMADVIAAVLGRETDKLNKDAKDPNWFLIVSDRPIVTDARIPFSTVSGMAGFLGVFFGFWAVMVRRYWNFEFGAL